MPFPIDADTATETLVIGASAAGLATAARLRGLGRPFEIVEAADAVAAVWRGHYDRLHLHTPKSLSGLPDLPMPKDWPRYPSRDQVVEYLELYRRHFALEPQFGERVARIERDGAGWKTTTSQRSWRSANVVIATGRARVPVRPSWPGLEEFRGEVLHSSEYRRGDRWAGRPVLVVGFGNSACEQALDLAEHGADAHLSVRSPVNVIPRDLFGRVPILRVALLMHYLPARLADALSTPILRLAIGDIRRVGLQKLPYGPLTQIARHQQVPLIDVGTMQQLKAGRITLRGTIDRFDAQTAWFRDGSKLMPAAVVLATGYAPGVNEFLDEWRMVCDDDGSPLRSGGPSGLPGLYFCGMRVSTRGMLHEINREARQISEEIARGSTTRP